MRDPITNFVFAGTSRESTPMRYVALTSALLWFCCNRKLVSHLALTLSSQTVNCKWRCVRSRSKVRLEAGCQRMPTPYKWNVAYPSLCRENSGEDEDVTILHEKVSRVEENEVLHFQSETRKERARFGSVGWKRSMMFGILSGGVSFKSGLSSSSQPLL
ncbi:hypothetical protein KEM48_008043 [Puccinia striiformis f. sp. tritici PST-130]|nr:hypothetical protein KEM48_008043 [Puccinia striiformis f. sp. tritici PST-130]